MDKKLKELFGELLSYSNAKITTPINYRSVEEDVIFINNLDVLVLYNEFEKHPLLEHTFKDIILPYFYNSQKTDLSENILLKNWEKWFQEMLKYICNTTDKNLQSLYLYKIIFWYLILEVDESIDHSIFMTDMKKFSQKSILRYKLTGISSYLSARSTNDKSFETFNYVINKILNFEEALAKNLSFDMLNYSHLNQYFEFLNNQSTEDIYNLYILNFTEFLQYIVYDSDISNLSIEENKSFNKTITNQDNSIKIKSFDIDIIVNDTEEIENHKDNKSEICEKESTKINNSQLIITKIEINPTNKELSLNYLKTENLNELKTIILPPDTNEYKNIMNAITSSNNHYIEDIILELEKNQNKKIENQFHLLSKYVAFLKHIYGKNEKIYFIGDSLFIGDKKIVLGNELIEDLINKYQDRKEYKIIQTFLLRLLEMREDLTSQIYRFLKSGKVILDENGDIYLYKKVNFDYSDIYSRTKDYTPGNIVREVEEKISTDPTYTCAPGLHACTWGYLPSYGSLSPDSYKIIVVKVPLNKIRRIPKDHNSQKLAASELHSHVDITDYYISNHYPSEDMFDMFDVYSKDELKKILKIDKDFIVVGLDNN